MGHFLWKAQVRSVTAQGKVHSWDWQRRSVSNTTIFHCQMHTWALKKYWQSSTAKRLFPLQCWLLTGTATKRGGETWAVSLGQDPQTRAGPRQTHHRPARRQHLHVRLSANRQHQGAASTSRHKKIPKKAKLKTFSS